MSDLKVGDRLFSLNYEVLAYPLVREHKIVKVNKKTYVLNDDEYVLKEGVDNNVLKQWKGSKTYYRTLYPDTFKKAQIELVLRKTFSKNMPYSLGYFGAKRKEYSNAITIDYKLGDFYDKNKNFVNELARAKKVFDNSFEEFNKLREEFYKRIKGQ